MLKKNEYSRKQVLQDIRKYLDTGQLEGYLLLKVQEKDYGIVEYILYFDEKGVLDMRLCLQIEQTTIVYRV